MGYKVALESLGCSKNLVDSEVMLGILKEHGYFVTDSFAEAHIIIVNTCGFIESAKQESINAILSLAQYKDKKKGQCELLVVTGCLAQKYREDLRHEIPEIDGILGTIDFQQIADLVGSKLGHQVKSTCEPSNVDLKRHLMTPKHTVYVKIAEGCDNRCTYCTIPALRGRYRSRSMENIVEEVINLVQGGVKEIVLVAQDTTYYGVDIYGEPRLPELLETLAKEEIYWIRLLYCYPARISDKLIDVIAQNPNICNYLDIPLQHSDDEILVKMNRKETSQELIDLIAKIRRKIPDVALRTTFMVGFPGETEDRFQNLLDFVANIKFDWLGAFTYSQEEDTPAAKMEDQVAREIKDDRYHRLMALQSEISVINKQKWVGKTISVMVEGKSSDNMEYFIGRSQYHAPEVDGIIYFKADQLEIGEIVQVRITESDVYDIMGEIVQNEPR